jgi:cyclic beta-1,2-glucan synthetase
MLRVALESILGVTVEAGRILIVNPCLPDAWPRCGVRWRRPGCGTVYELAIVNPKGCTAVVVAATADGESLDVSSGVCRVPLVRDGETHHVEVVLGARGA